MRKDIKVFAPASVSNIACGFDIMGFAIDEPGDEIILRQKETSGVTITKITGDNGKLPLEACKNTAGAPVIALLKHLGINPGIEIEIHKKMPLGSGLGSSAASAVAAAFALNELLDAKLTKEELLPFAIEGEKIASGAVHADNVAPCLWGGFILIRGYEPIDIVEIPVPDNLYCTIIHPEIEIQTKEARKILPKEVPLKDAITQWGNTAGLVAGLMKSDFNLISRSLKDVIVEPVRSALIPSYYKMKDAALSSGALGCNISGSGPSLFALSTSYEISERIGRAMQGVLEQTGLPSQVYISKINKQGPRII
ncbi:MAG: homoserine kinase [Bacteroidota bacterium]|nr:homoserine kinase [Bacteroidota bacterium]MDP4194741.1 homoserine kinase [Bacteroidota bacterium]